jgi:pimeloyl-ACP methyl ester carboxylesterase
MRRCRGVVAAVMVPLLAAPSSAQAQMVLIPPVDAPILVRFQPPAHRFAPGHRGIDYSVAEGTPVRASGEGTVSFAGKVGLTVAVTIQHPGGYETTYSSLSELSVAQGERVAQGTWIGTSGLVHPNGEPGLHLGLKLDGSYVDPEQLLPAVDVSEAIHLAPLSWDPSAIFLGGTPEGLRDAGDASPPCRGASALTDVPERAPNENVAVAIAGIGSSTKDGVNADMYEHGPEELGYSSDRIYRFSYGGLKGERLHEPYRSTDTFGDIREAAAQLQRLLAKIAEEHPGRRVDLIAHSMGGLVARSFLSELADGSRGLPAVEHLVTFATPHRGSSIATLPDRLQSEIASGPALLDAASRWAQRGGPFPDPRSVAVDQLDPGSSFISALSSEDVAYGTRVLTLATPNDLVVTADRALWEHATARVVPPSGLDGHSSIVASDLAQGVAYSFLRGAPDPCRRGWDLWGPRIGRGIGLAQENSLRALGALERTQVGRLVRHGLAWLF